MPCIGELNLSINPRNQVFLSWFFASFFLFLSGILRIFILWCTIENCPTYFFAYQLFEALQTVVMECYWRLATVHWSDELEGKKVTAESHLKMFFFLVFKWNLLWGQKGKTLKLQLFKRPSVAISEITILCGTNHSVRFWGVLFKFFFHSKSS